jgi:ankyrin repeat protein
VLLVHGADLAAADEHGFTPFHTAADRGHPALVELLLEHRADVNAPTHDDWASTPLHLVAQAEFATPATYRETAEVLLAHLAEVNAKAGNGQTPLHRAADKGHLAVAKLLVAHQANVNAKAKDGATPLHQVALNGDAGFAKLLLSNRADIGARTQKGHAPLHWAAVMGQIDIVNELLNQGADANVMGTELDVPMHFAASGGHENVVKVLIARGADVNAKKFTGETPLFMASDGGHRGVVELLISNEADVNIGNMTGNTALHAAAWKGHKEVVEVLLANNANANATNNMGLTPAQVVQGEENVDITELLRKHAAPLRHEPGSAEFDGTRVGELGDHARIVFEGAETFARKALIKGLMENADFLLASHPAAPFDAYLDILEQMVFTGYQHAGFSSAKVSTSFDTETQRIVVKVVEGRRYMAGPIKVTGAETVPAGTLIRRLTESYPAPEDTIQLTGLKNTNTGLQGAGFEYIDSTGKQVTPQPPVWLSGEPVSFDASSVKDISFRISNTLADLGYYFPNMNVEVVPNAVGQTAELQIEILEEGPKAVIESIDVIGNIKNSREDVIDYLGLEPGMLFNRDLKTKTDMLLWNSARFFDYQITPERLDAEDSRIKLSIDLTEHEPAPPISENFSAEENALLKLRLWLAGAQSRNDDFVIDMGDLLTETGILQLILSNNGAMAQVTETGPSGNAYVAHAIVLSTDYFGIFSPPQGRKLIDRGWEKQWQASASILPNPEAGAGKFALSLGGGLSTSDSKSTASPLRFSTLFAPVAFVDFAHRPDGRVSIQDGILTVNSGRNLITADAQSGELLSFLIKTEEESSISVDVVKGAFDSAIRTLESDTKGHRDFLNTESRFGSWAGYILEDLLRSESLSPILFEQVSPETRERAAAALRKLFSAQVLLPLDQLATQIFGEDGEDGFYIPPEQPETIEAATSSVVTMLSAAIYRLSSDFLPKGSWPLIAARETVFVVGGKGKYTGAELERAYKSDDIGPIGYLVIAELLTYIKHPAVSAFAQRGLEQLSATDFRKDARLLFEKNSGLADSFARMAAAIKNLDDKDVEALAAILPPGAGEFIRQSVQLLRGRNGTPLDEVLLPAFDEYWVKELKGKVQVRLSKLAEQ